MTRAISPAPNRAISEASQMRRELLGNVHPLVAQTLNNIAFVYYDRGEVRAALDAERESLDIYRKLFAGDNPDVARIMNRLGYWLTESGEYRDANRYLEQVLAMRTRLSRQVESRDRQQPRACCNSSSRHAQVS